MAAKKQNWGWLRHVLTGLSVTIFLLGCGIIGYMSWVLATSTSVNRFMSGTLVFTYVIIGFAFALFLTGLIGWVGSIIESLWLIRLFLGAGLLCMAAEVGGLITLNFSEIQVDDILEHGWKELNQGTRNLVQTSLECCGFDGPQEFAYSTLPIDDSCYEELDTPLLKKDGCGPKLRSWFETNKLSWVVGLSIVGAIQFMAIAVALFISRRVQINSKQRTYSRRKLREYEAEMAKDPLPSELP